MKDMTIIDRKKIVSKKTNEVRLVVSIDEENRKIFSVPVDEPNAEPSVMAAATYDRWWGLYEEPAAAEKPETHEEPAAADEPKTDAEPMKMSDVITKLEGLFDLLNRVYFENALPKPVITVQSTPRHTATAPPRRSGRPARKKASTRSTSAPSSSIGLPRTLRRLCATRWSISTAS